MKFIKNDFIPVKGFTAINICGLLFYRDEEKINERVVKHELVHSMQQRELWFIGFFLLYLLEWAWKCSYRNISFEREARQYEPQGISLKERKKGDWKKFILPRK